MIPTKKNKALFAFLSNLVRCHFFHTELKCFLAHTHEDIDQMFSTITIFLLNEKMFALIVILTFKDFLTFQKKPGLILLSALVLFDNTKHYTEYRDSVIHHLLKASTVTDESVCRQ